MLRFVHFRLALLVFTFSLVFCTFASADPEVSWNTFLGSGSDDVGNFTAVGNNGSLYVTGRSLTTWGSPVNAKSHSHDTFVAKLDSNGMLQWHTFLGSIRNDYGSNIIVDNNGDLYILGASDSSWGAPINPFTGSFPYHDVFVSKLDSSGVLQWHTFLGSSDYDRGHGMVSDGSGNLYISGYSVSDWGNPINDHAGETDAFVAKLNSSGMLQWSTFLGSSNPDYGQSISVDGNGNIYVTGYSHAGWGAPINPFAGGLEAFVAKLDSSGVLQWNTFLGSGNYDYGQSVSVDDSGNIYVTGYSDAGWGAPINAHFGGNDVFVAKLDSSGALQWHTFLGSGSGDIGYSVSADSSGNLYVTGWSDAGWGSPMNAHTGGNDVFLAKLDSSGVLQWNTFLGSSGTDCGHSVSTDGSGNLYVSGYSNAGWGAPINAYAGGNDVFVAKLYDLDIDDDGWTNDTDGCPYDLHKNDPGICGCGVDETDTDSDGMPDCNDTCPDDPDKTDPGICGCGVADSDTDSDGTPDCNDNCPDDPNKTDSGTCGCGVADTDTDNDGTPDCNDNCPNDPNKTDP